MASLRTLLIALVVLCAVPVAQLAPEQSVDPSINPGNSADPAIEAVRKSGLARIKVTCTSITEFVSAADVGKVREPKWECQASPADASVEAKSRAATTLPRGVAALVVSGALLML